MAPAPHLEPDTPGDVVELARALRSVAERAEAELLTTAATYAGMHATGHVVTEAEWLEDSLVIAGPGAPEIAEFCVAEFAAALGLSTDAGRRYLGEAAAQRARATSLHSAEAITGSRPRPPGPTPSSSPVPICGPALTDTASSATTRAPST